MYASPRSSECEIRSYVVIDDKACSVAEMRDRDMVLKTQP
ncbi:unnamed protein product [Nezara viridula]|uniref:Uncharacterized protein n=1 Tax=Nezara viridula TaxID=85310 RepID=A0A9P0HUN3_NEZVI|nr:unnamed protein product [Nezara viridula]